MPPDFCDATFTRRSVRALNAQQYKCRDMNIASDALLAVPIDDADHGQYASPCGIQPRRCRALVPLARQNLAGFTCESWGRCRALRTTHTVASIVQPAAHGLYGQLMRRVGRGLRHAVWPCWARTGCHMAPDHQGDTQTTLPADPSAHENRKPSIAASVPFGAAGLFRSRVLAARAGWGLHCGGGRPSARGMRRRLVGVRSCHRPGSARS